MLVSSEASRLEGVEEGQAGEQDRDHADQSVAAGGGDSGIAGLDGRGAHLNLSAGGGNVLDDAGDEAFQIADIAGEGSAKGGLVVNLAQDRADQGGTVGQDRADKAGNVGLGVGKAQAGKDNQKDGKELVHGDRLLCVLWMVRLERSSRLM